MQELQQRLLRTGHYVPALAIRDNENLAAKATVTASSTFQLAELPADGPLLHLEKEMAQMVPLPEGPLPEFTFFVDSESSATIEVELRTTSDAWHHTPNVVLDRQSMQVGIGKMHRLKICSKVTMPRAGYLFIIFKPNPHAWLHTSQARITGVLRLAFARHEEHEAVGGDKYDSYYPERRPKGHNLAFQVNPGIDLFKPATILNGWQRPNYQPNAWMATADDSEPSIELTWPTPQRIGHVQIYFDGDYDHPLETVLMRHPERAVPFGVRNYQVLDDHRQVRIDAKDCHQSRVSHHFDPSLETTSLSIRITETWGALPAVFEVRCYE
jgi:hypothetical protein